MWPDYSSFVRYANRFVPAEVRDVAFACVEAKTVDGLFFFQHFLKYDLSATMNTNRRPLTGIIRFLTASDNELAALRYS